MSKVFSDMSSPSSKPFQVSLSDIIEKVRCYSACCSGQVIVEDHCNLDKSNDKEKSAEDFEIIEGILLQCLLLQLIKIIL